MGTPIKIVDLAKKMIRLAGYEPGKEIKLEYTSPRPGEKLNEELIDTGESILPTLHEKIKLLKTLDTTNKDFINKVDDLCQMATQSEPLKLRHALFELSTTDFFTDEKISEHPKPKQKEKR